MDTLATQPELLLPAGGFEAGVAAFEGGADAVYLGFRSFSARKQARNFDEDEYRRLLALARARGRKVYAAVNTVLTDEDDGPLSALLAFMEDFPPDALIFQDWGLASFVAERLPALPLHASTQTAIQTVDAARLAMEAGVSRIVLPRETTVAELAAFHEALPGMEFEVFVHGALCYSFSGLCLASGLLLGRSGNRGECAQVCRSWYGDTDGRESYAFSCGDLELVDALRDIAGAGAVSLKVEGRMKSPEYVYAVARLYRAGLDSLAGKPADRMHFEELRREARLAFGRTPTAGYGFSPRGDALLDTAYPGHRGLPLGKVLSSSGGRLRVELESSLGLRDGVLALGEGARGRLEGEAFAAQDITDARSGRSLVTARPGSRVEFASPLDLRPGTALRLVSARTMDRRSVSPASFDPALRTVPAGLGVAEGSAGNSGRLVLELALPPRSGRPGGEILRIEDGEELSLAAGRTPGGFRKVEALFLESGDHDFRLAVRLDEAARIAPEGEDIPLADLFVPPSLLKKAKNRLYDALSERLASEAAAERAFLLEGLKSIASAPEIRGKGLPPRAILGFPREDLDTLLPFAMPRDLSENRPLPGWDGWSWLPLAPVVADWPAYASLVAARVKAELAAGSKIMLGIDGLHHAALARSLRADSGEGGSLGFFGDIHLYAATARSAKAWTDFVPGLRFSYPWIEAPSPSAAGLFEGFEPPLFISKGCHLRHALSGGTCPPACGRRLVRRLEDRDRRYLVLVEDCITMLFRVGTGG